MPPGTGITFARFGTGNTAKPVEGKKNIGIRNVNQRIKLACGEQYGITIESTPYQGSRFTIQLPIMREGEENET